MLCKRLFCVLFLFRSSFLSTKVTALDAKYSNLPPRAEEKFFLYDWPAVCHRGGSGAGKLLNATSGIYSTEQYNIFGLIHARLLSDPRRTFRPEEATTFFIPYDLFTDSMTVRKPNGRVEHSYFEGRSDLAPEVFKLLKASPYFLRNHGADHVLIVGWPYVTDQLILRPKAIPLLTLCTNCTKLSTESHLFLYPSSIRNLAQELKGNNWFAIPYPSNFHFSSKVKAPLPYEATERPLLVSYIGTSWCFSEPATNLRTELVRYCALYGPNDCQHAHYSKYGPRASRLSANSVDAHSIYSMRSIFCFQPLGDTTARKGIFDAIHYGCIPVLFHPLSASAMYTLHWSPQLWRDIVIEIPFNLSRSSNHTSLLDDPILYLKNMVEKDQAGIERRQRLLRQYAFMLSYALESYNRSSSGGSFPSAWPRDEGGSPLRDAYEIAMDHVLGTHARGWVPVSGVEAKEVWRNDIDMLLPTFYHTEFESVLEAFKAENNVSMQSIIDGHVMLSLT